MPETTSRSSSLLMRLLALAVLVVAAYVLFKVVLGFLIGLFYVVAIIAALVAVVWAYRTLKRR